MKCLGEKICNIPFVFIIIFYNSVFYGEGEGSKKTIYRYKAFFPFFFFILVFFIIYLYFLPVLHDTVVKIRKSTYAKCPRPKTCYVRDVWRGGFRNSESNKEAATVARTP